MNGTVQVEPQHTRRCDGSHSHQASQASILSLRASQPRSPPQCNQLQWGHPGAIDHFPVSLGLLFFLAA